MTLSRSAGLLLHVTSLPGRGGIGTVGSEAYRFVDEMVASGISLWQILPLQPTGYGNSPYSALSAFAGNSFLIALERLAEEGLLRKYELDEIPPGPEHGVDFGALIPVKDDLLRRAYERFDSESEKGFDTFREDNAGWLPDFTLYMAVKDEHGGVAWSDWERPLRTRQPQALDDARRRLAGQIDRHSWEQWIFFNQWQRLRAYANERGIRIVGDMPIFVAYDSADVWAHQDLFQLDAEGAPTVVAGVPPDLFTATGQLWGNPIYRWDVMAETGFTWWIERFRQLLRVVDIIRVDHFRGFAAAWHVPYGNETAEHGEWVKAPGKELFAAVRAALGDLPIMVEDLGVITEDVNELRQSLGYPGMKILQWAFDGDPTNGSLPHTYPHDCVVYSGTHDNDTALGWYASLPPKEQAWAARYLGHPVQDISWDLMRLAFASVADVAIVPMQDVLRLGTEARMNLPGTADGNWEWRMEDGEFSDEHMQGLRDVVETYGRLVPLLDPRPNVR